MNLRPSPKVVIALACGVVAAASWATPCLTAVVSGLAGVAIPIHAQPFPSADLNMRMTAGQGLREAVSKFLLNGNSATHYRIDSITLGDHRRGYVDLSAARHGAKRLILTPEGNASLLATLKQHGFADAESYLGAAMEYVGASVDGYDVKNTQLTYERSPQSPSGMAVFAGVKTYAKQFQEHHFTMVRNNGTAQPYLNRSGLQFAQDLYRHYRVDQSASAAVEFSKFVDLIEADMSWQNSRPEP